MKECRMQFVMEFEAGHYRRAMELLLFMASHYETHGFSSAEERNGFELIATWFNKEVVQAGYVTVA